MRPPNQPGTTLIGTTHLVSNHGRAKQEPCGTVLIAGVNSYSQLALNGLS